MSNNADDKKDMKKVFESTDELCSYLWPGLPRKQLLANKVWLRQMHSMIKDGGLWTYPHMGLIFEKRGKGFALKE